ncbi:MAG TPA: hypothetical protein VLH35_07855 [Candidatus Acidoferrales bacterium]|nr:hypothetical protein [Candidatus Acidoferrales bacterium]
MNKKTIYIVVAVIVVILIVGVAGVMLLNNGNGGTTNPTATPTPTPAATIVGANTLQFNVNDSSAQLLYTYKCKNFNSSSEVIRVDMNLGAAGNYSYIIDMGASKSWTSTNAGTTWTASTDFAADVTNYATPFYAYVNKIAEQSNTADFAYTSTISIYGITVNPTFAASVFAVS